MDGTGNPEDTHSARFLAPSPGRARETERAGLAAEVKGDIDKLLGEWDRWGWHRVTFYGDHRRTIQQFGALMGFTVSEEA